jgi:hypothetical protein
MNKSDREHFYKTLWCALRRIELGKREIGDEEITRESMIALAKMALNVVPEPPVVPKGYKR